MLQPHQDAAFFAADQRFAGTSALNRLAQENLVSFVVTSSGSVETDKHEIAAIGDFAAISFAHYEVLLVASRPNGVWRAEMREMGTRVGNLRIVMVESSMGYEELSTAALRFAIGDLVVSLHPGELQISDVVSMIERCAEAECDLVKTFHARDTVPAWERLAAKWIQRLLRVLTGRGIQPFQARAFALNRTALSRLQTIGGALRYFRLFNLSGLVAEEHLVLDYPPKRHLLDSFMEKLRIASMLVSSSAERLILWLALVCAVLSVGSFLSALLAIAIWMFKETIAPGWTSLSVEFSLLFAANFGVLGAICLGLLQMIRQNTPDPVELFATEMSGGDLFRRSNELNVQAQAGMPPAAREAE